MGHPLPIFRARRPARPAFTLIELMLTLLIMSIIAVLGMDAISEFEATQRPERAARESLAFFRSARNIAMTTGKKAKVVINTANRTVSIYWQKNGSTYDTNPYATSMTATGTAVLNLNSNRELVGTSVTVTPATTPEFEYSALGTCDKKGQVYFSYGGRTKYLDVKFVGDPDIK
jgi:prepilin-type N-terminal cleavage/methylation domain-containing protein